MHVFHIKGFSGITVFALAILLALSVVLLLPATFMMVLWNAFVYELFKGPEINVWQGFLIWGITLIVIKLVFNPEIALKFQRDPFPETHGTHRHYDAANLPAATEKPATPEVSVLPPKDDHRPTNSH